jgi:hypothetical protein
MGHELSLLCSQESATCPYNEPNQSVPVPPSISGRSILTLYPHLCRYYMWSLSLSFLLHMPLLSPYVPHVLSIYMPCPSNFSWFDNLNNIWWVVNYYTILNIYCIFSNLICTRIYSALSFGNFLSRKKFSWGGSSPLCLKYIIKV